MKSPSQIIRDDEVCKVILKAGSTPNYAEFIFIPRSMSITEFFKEFEIAIKDQVRK